MPNVADSTTTSAVQYAESAAPSTPASGQGKTYFDTSGRFRSKNDAGSDLILAEAFGNPQTAPTELPIATGAITVTQGFHKVDTEADAATDNLDTINGGITNALYLLRPEDAGRTIAIRHNGGGTGNIRTLDGQTLELTDIFEGALLWYDGTTYNVLSSKSPGFPNNHTNWGGYPDNTLKFSGQETGGAMYEVDGNELVYGRIYTLTVSAAFDAVPMMQLTFNHATAIVATINDSTIASGMAWVAQCLIAPGAGSHDILLPSGVTWDGTNRRAQFTTVTDLLEGTFISATRFLLKPTTTGVTFAAS